MIDRTNKQTDYINTTGNVVLFLLSMFYVQRQYQVAVLTDASAISHHQGLHTLESSRLILEHVSCWCCCCCCRISDK